MEQLFGDGNVTDSDIHHHSSRFTERIISAWRVQLSKDTRTYFEWKGKRSTVGKHIGGNPSRSEKKECVRGPGGHKMKCVRKTRPIRHSSDRLLSLSKEAIKCSGVIRQSRAPVFIASPRKPKRQALNRTMIQKVVQGSTTCGSRTHKGLNEESSIEKPRFCQIGRNLAKKRCIVKDGSTNNDPLRGPWISSDSSYITL